MTEDTQELILNLAKKLSGETEVRMDGSAYCFVTSDYPEGPAGFGEDEFEAAIEFLKEHVK